MPSCPPALQLMPTGSDRCRLSEGQGLRDDLVSLLRGVNGETGLPGREVPPRDTQLISGRASHCLSSPFATFAFGLYQLSELGLAETPVCMVSNQTRILVTEGCCAQGVFRSAQQSVMQTRGAAEEPCLPGMWRNIARAL